MWRVNGNPHPCTNLDEPLHTHPYLPKKGLGEVLTLAHIPSRPEILKAKGKIFENCYNQKQQKVAQTILPADGLPKTP